MQNCLVIVILVTVVCIIFICYSFIICYLFVICYCYCYSLWSRSEPQNITYLLDSTNEISQHFKIDSKVNNSYYYHCYYYYYDYYYSYYSYHYYYHYCFCLLSIYFIKSTLLLSFLTFLHRLNLIKGPYSDSLLNWRIFIFRTAQSASCVPWTGTCPTASPRNGFLKTDLSRFSGLRRHKNRFADLNRNVGVSRVQHLTCADLAQV